MTVGDQIILERTEERENVMEEVGSVERATQDDKFDKILQTMRELRSDLVVTMNDKFIEYEERIASRFDGRMSASETKIVDVESRQIQLHKEVNNVEVRQKKQSSGDLNQRITDLSNRDPTTAPSVYLKLPI